MSRGAIFLTVDLDLVDYLDGGTPIDECGARLDPFLRILQRHPAWKVTWLVRLDSQIEAERGDVTNAYDEASTRLRSYVENGHELAWHPHAYVRHGASWRQNTDGDSVAQELQRCAAAARSCRFTSVRMGWGFHTNATLTVLAEAGFKVDSTAIPRPVYPWDRAKDWSVTPTTPYRPSRSDYRVPGSPALPILELPISVAPLRAPYDNDEVIRYLNPAYQPSLLRPVLESWFSRHDYVVLVTHPHEMFPRAGGHPMLACSEEAFEENVSALEGSLAAMGIAPRFLTLADAVAEFAAA